MYLRIVIILLFILISQSSSAQVHDESVKNGDSAIYYLINNFYKGTIGKKIQIFMSLKIDIPSKSLTGYYYYKKERKLIGLEGRLEANGTFMLNESILFNDNGQVKEKKTGSFIGQFEDSYNTMKGKWASPDKKENFPFDLAADEDRTYLSRQEHPEYHQAAFQFLDNLQIHNNLKELLKKRIDTKRSFLEAEITDPPTIVYSSENLISILIYYRQYRNSGHVSLNFWLVDNSIKELELSDFFIPNSNYLKILSDNCIIELRRQRGVDSDLAKNLSQYISYNFTMTPEALKFYFARFGAEGERSCEIPLRKIRGIINPKGPLSGFILSKESLYMKNPDKDNALIEAINDFNEDAVNVLLKKGANVNAKDESGNAALLIAVGNQMKGAAITLLDNGADINEKNKKGDSALTIAVRDNQIQIATLLIEKGANMNAKNNSGDTPLHIANYNNLKDMIEVLLSKNADINVRDKDEYTPLLYNLIHYNGNLLELYLRYEADVNIPNKYGNTPLIYAGIYEGSVKLAKLILSKGANVNAKNKEGSTALNGVVDEDLAELLISHGADVNNHGRFGETPLISAAARGRKDVVKLLISKGALINDGQTALMFATRFAIEYGQKEIVELLISMGADVNIRNKAGETALKIALKAGKTEIAELLKSHGAIE